MRHYTMLHLAYRWLGHDSSASKQPRKNRECISPLPPFPLSEYHSFYGWSELKLHSFFYQKHWWILTLPSASNGRWLVHLGVWHVWSRDWTGYNTISRLWILLVAYLLLWIFKNWCSSQIFCWKIYWRERTGGEIQDCRKTVIQFGARHGTMDIDETRCWQTLMSPFGCVLSLLKVDSMRSICIGISVLVGHRLYNHCTFLDNVRFLYMIHSSR